MDGLSAAASVFNVIQIAQTVCSLCHEYAKSVKNARNDIVCLQQELNGLESVLQGADKLLHGPKKHALETSQTLIKALKDCQSQVESLKEKLEFTPTQRSKRRDRIQNRLRVRDLKWPFERTEVENIVQRLRNSRENLSASLAIDQTALILEAFELVEFEERVKILNWISPVLIGEHHASTTEMRTAGTCNWLIQHERFHEWEDKSSSAVLWLQGIPGAGKTFLTSRVIDHTQELIGNSVGRGFAFFYCNRNNNKRNQPLSILRSYLRQLSMTPGDTAKVWKKVQGLYRDAQLKALELSFNTCKEKLLEAVNMYETTTFVLDALDECDAASRSQLLDIIQFLLSNSKNTVKFFISSRPDRDIREAFSSKPNIEIQARHNEGDIAKFVFSEITKHGNWKGMRQSLQKDIIRVLLEHSDGMFQWVNLQVKQLLDLESEEAISSRLGKLPDTLTKAYNEIYNRIQARDENDRVFADRAITWVMACNEPLNIEMLLSAILVGPEGTVSKPISASQLLHLCSNLLTIQQGVWKFSHLSVREYFEHNHLKHAQAHCFLAKVCLSHLNSVYVNFEALGSSNYEGSTDGWTDESTDDGPQLMQNEEKEIFDRLRPLGRYSNKHWITHIQTQENEEVDHALANVLKSFLGPFSRSSAQFRKWHRHACGIHHISSFETPMLPEHGNVFWICKIGCNTLLADWWMNDKCLISMTSKTGDNLLNIAAYSGSTSMCGALLKLGMSVDQQSGSFGTALVAAAKNSRIGVMEFLIEHGAEVNHPLQIGDYGSALVAAAGKYNIDTLRYLVDHGADVNQSLQTGKYGSALAAAAAVSNFRSVQYLINNGADINQPLQTGKYGSALAAAAARFRLNNIRYLVEHGADINQSLQTGKYGSALAAAATTVHTFNVRYLVDNGADINQPLQIGDYGSALAAAAARYHLNNVQYLVEHGADINQSLQTGKYGSALAAAAAENNIHCARYLLEHGADVNQFLQSGKYGNALAAAASEAHFDIMIYLIQNGADINLARELLSSLDIERSHHRIKEDERPDRAEIIDMLRAASKSKKTIR